MARQSYIGINGVTRHAPGGLFRFGGNLRPDSSFRQAIVKYAASTGCGWCGRRVSQWCQWLDRFKFVGLISPDVPARTLLAAE